MGGACSWPRAILSDSRPVRTAPTTPWHVPVSTRPSIHPFTLMPSIVPLMILWSGPMLALPPPCRPLDSRHGCPTTFRLVPASPCHPLPRLQSVLPWRRPVSRLSLALQALPSSYTGMPPLPSASYTRSDAAELLIFLPCRSSSGPGPRLVLAYALLPTFFPSPLAHVRVSVLLHTRPASACFPRSTRSLPAHPLLSFRLCDICLRLSRPLGGSPSCTSCTRTPPLAFPTLSLC
jgi:hypothetical protein